MEVSIRSDRDGISRKGIDYDSVDGEPVNLLFIVASPPDMRLEYLAALSVITGLVRNKHFREELLGSRDPQAIQTKMCKAFRENLLFRVRRFSTPTARSAERARMRLGPGVSRRPRAPMPRR
jgi:hypothetical protein